MIEEINLETFLHVSNNKYHIIVFDKKNFKNLYSEELIIYNESNIQDLSNLSKFLDKNIFRIEKIVGNFIKNIILIIENNETLQVNIGIKKKIMITFSIIKI